MKGHIPTGNNFAATRTITRYFALMKCLLNADLPFEKKINRPQEICICNDCYCQGNLYF